MIVGHHSISIATGLVQRYLAQLEPSLGWDSSAVEGPLAGIQEKLDLENFGKFQ